MPARAAAGVLLVALAYLAGYLSGQIGAVRIDADAVVAGRERVTVRDGPIPFLARLDTGALVSSVHARDIEVVNADRDDPRRNRGKMVRFTLDNGRGAEVALERPVVLVKRIRSADCVEWRYHVWLTIEFRGSAHRVLVNLNDRSHAQEPLLLGRNWIRRGYVVDLSLAPADPV